MRTGNIMFPYYSMNMGIFTNLKSIIINLDNDHRDKHETFLKRKELFELKRRIQIQQLKRDVDRLFINEKKNLQSFSAETTGR